ncbi:hypothetical protein C2G38_2248442 [Gigaspora rosea]|uniref:Ion transport domain-containing protein n=1 Tax=Gigaspora rosea TaxID=44941 RepID=A0A397UV33_9GLOM|nr:hypothetical protein C2G38_2248442 [Gigaspora rosea]
MSNEEVKVSIPSETEDIKKHKESIDRIFVSQYMNDTGDTYVVTYSKEDNSIVGWSVHNIENDGQQQPDEFYKLKEESYKIESFALYKKFLSLCYCVKDESNYKQCLIDLNSKPPQFFELEHSYSNYVRGRYTIGFLPNGDLILVSICNHKIYKYLTNNMPKNIATLKYSETYDIEIPKSLYDQSIYCSMYQEKLFLFIQNRKTSILQFDLLKMNLDRRYDSPINWNSLYSSKFRYEFTIVIMNKNRTLLAVEILYYTCIFSMENGRLISNLSSDIFMAGTTPIEFITLKNGFEGLFVVCSKYHRLFKSIPAFINPYRPSENVSNFEENNSNDIDNSNAIITKLNRKFFIDGDGNICVTNGLDEDKFQQISNKITYRNSIYDSSTFKEIQNILKEIVEKEEIDRVEPAKIQFEDGNIIFEKDENRDIIKFEINNINLAPRNNPYILSYKLINNQQDLVLINVEKIEIFIRDENSITGITSRYQWYNNKWEDTYAKFRNENLGFNKHFTTQYYKQLFNNILDNEFNDSNFLIPLPRFELSLDDFNNSLFNEFRNNTKALSRLVLEMSSEEIDYQQKKQRAIFIINDADMFSKYGLEILKVAINKKYEDIVKQVIDRIIKSIQSIQNNLKTYVFTELNPSQTNCSYMMILLPFMSLNFLELCKNYPDFIIKYISCTSIILSPYCDSITSSTNTSLHSYTDICIKKTNLVDDYFKLISSSFNSLTQSLRNQEEVQKISFIVPFPKICVYKDRTENNHKKDNYNQEAKNNYKKDDYKDNSKKNDQNDNQINIWNEFLYKPKSILFCNIDSLHFYNWWNFAAIIDFKWRTFGRIYYYSIWFLYTVFCICYALASILEPNSITNIQRNSLFIITIIFGSKFLIFEILQCFWKPKYYFNDPWNYFDISAYSLPIATSICWLINKSLPPWLVALSIILLSFKFLLFFRIFKSYGIYFAIILGVAKTVSPFLVILLFIIIGYAQAFHFILRSTNNNDANNPWNLASRYYFASSNKIINNTTTLVQPPTPNTNLFDWFPTSLFAVYNMITGDSGSLSSWTYQENPLMTLLLVTFTFFTVIYLLNLFIGLLNIAISDYNKEEEYLLQKARIIIEIELLYMFPYLKHKKEWFPDWIYYDMPITEVRKLINAIDNDRTVFNYYLPVISADLRNLVALDDIKEKQIKKQIDELEQQINNFQQQIYNLQQQTNEFQQQMSLQLGVLIQQMVAQQMIVQNQQIDIPNQQTGVPNQPMQQIRNKDFFLSIFKVRDKDIFFSILRLENIKDQSDYTIDSISTNRDSYSNSLI